MSMQIVFTLPLHRHVSNSKGHQHPAHVRRDFLFHHTPSASAVSLAILLSGYPRCMHKKDVSAGSSSVVSLLVP